jgi:DNA-binding CsgD family transcriptional regulator
LDPADVVGRSDEVERLTAIVARAMTERGQAALVEGEPGIGKTTILDVVAAECHRRGARVLRGKADDLDRRLPFAAIGTCIGVKASAADPDIARVAGLIRGEYDQKSTAAIAAADLEFLVTEAILDVIDKWCGAGPVALLLDDLQWADPPSLLVLHRLGAAIAEMPLLVVGACRPIPRREELEGLLRRLDARGAVSITLGPLPEKAVTQLATRLLGAPPGPRLAELVAGAAGNPMYISELITGLQRESAIETSGGVAEIREEREPAVVPGPAAGQPGARVTGSLVTTIAGRLDFLSRRTREALRVAAVLGPSFDVTELATVLGTPAIEQWEVITEAIQSGLLVDAGERLVFRHDLIRQALAEDLPPAVRTALHLQIGRALADMGAPPERVAEHLMSGTALDGRTLDWLTGAARALMLRAPDLAVDMLSRALALVETDEPHAEVLRFQLSRALVWAGRPGEAANAARKALAANRDPRREGSLRWLIAQALFQQGHQQEAIEESERALALPHLSAGEAARFQGLIAQCYFFLGEMDAAVAAGRAVAEREGTGDAYAANYGLYVMAAVRLAERRVSEALELIDRAIAAMGGGETRLDRQITPHLVRGLCLMELDRFGEADEVFETGLRLGERGTGALPPAWYHWARADLRFMSGRWDEAATEIQLGLEAVDYLGITEVLRSVAALIAVHRGDEAAYAEVVIRPDTSPAAMLFGWHRRWARALAWEVEGKPNKALDLLVESWGQRIDGMPRHSVHYLCPDIARLAVALGERERVREVATATSKLTAVYPGGGMRGTAMLCQGAAEGDPAVVEQAAQAYQAAGRPLFEGHAMEIASALHADAGGAGRARSALDAAIEIYERLGAKWDAERAEALLAEKGVRRARRGRRRPTSGWESLTDIEHRVASLVAEGRTNPEIAAEVFLSRRTVQHHVSNALAKLGLTSRVELAVMVHQRGAAEDGAT